MALVSAKLPVLWAGGHFRPQGYSPVAVARRRRSFLLWAVPAVLLAAGGAFLLGRQQAEPVQEEGGV